MVCVFVSAVFGYRHTFVNITDLLTCPFHWVIAHCGTSRYREIDQNLLVLQIILNCIESLCDNVVGVNRYFFFPILSLFVLFSPFLQFFLVVDCDESKRKMCPLFSPMLVFDIWFSSDLLAYFTFLYFPTFQYEFIYNSLPRLLITLDWWPPTLVSILSNIGV